MSEKVLNTSKTSGAEQSNYIWTECETAERSIDLWSEGKNSTNHNKPFFSDFNMFANEFILWKHT